jgi:hypothetical protein
MKSTIGRTRTVTFAAFAAAAAMLALPALASAGDDLRIYKNEKQVTLNGDDETHTVSCKPDDFALDGMWRIDGADYDPDYDTWPDRARVVDVIHAYATSGHTYSFRFQKNAIGRAQAKIFVTCLGEKTDGGRTLTWGSVQRDNTVALATPGVHDVDSVHPGHTCTNQQSVTQPGFKLNAEYSPGHELGGDIVPARLVHSWPKGTFALTYKRWEWKFHVPPALVAPDEPADVTVYHRCLRTRYTTGSKWRLVWSFRPNHAGQTHTLPHEKRTVREVTCRDYYKGMIGAFKVLHPDHVWYMGMDPRIKKRAFTFINTSNSGTQQVTLGLYCLRETTT